MSVFYTATDYKGWPGPAAVETKEQKDYVQKFAACHHANPTNHFTVHENRFTRYDLGSVSFWGQQLRLFAMCFYVKTIQNYYNIMKNSRRNCTVRSWSYDSISTIKLIFVQHLPTSPHTITRLPVGLLPISALINYRFYYSAIMTPPDPFRSYFCDFFFWINF